MSDTNNSNSSDWVHLNVGGKTFQTTKDTLSRYPDSFLARLVNGDLPSDKDKSGAYLIDSDPEHFRTILTYLRRGILNLDGNEKTTKDLLTEADFYSIQPLVDDIRKTMSPVTKRYETIMLLLDQRNNRRSRFRMVCSEKHNDYDVLEAVRCALTRSNKKNVQGNDGKYTLYDTGSKYDWEDDKYYIDQFCLSVENQMEVEMILRSFGFVEESRDDNYDSYNNTQTRCWKFVRNVSK